LGSGSDDEDDDDDTIHSNEDDPDGVIPEELEDPTSPIDGLQHFDWGSADAELEEFMAERSEEDGDSDTDSVASGEFAAPSAYKGLQNHSIK
jgi:RNA polymerase II subunit A C-terminal domain phosphatase